MTRSGGKRLEFDRGIYAGRREMRYGSESFLHVMVFKAMRLD